MRHTLNDATPAEGPSATATGPGAPVGRRVILGICGLGALGVVLGERLQSLVGDAVSSISHASGSGLAALIPGANRFRLYTVTGTYPVISRRSFRLEIGGLVERPMHLTYDQLTALPRHELVRDFQCVTGWRVPDVAWTGVRLADLLDRAHPLPSARAVELASSDGVYTESLTLDEAHRYDVLVAYEMLGEPVTPGHGGPVRLYVAPMYGYKSIKWLRSIRLVEAATPGYWEQQGYAVQAWIGRSNGRHDAPVDA